MAGHFPRIVFTPSQITPITPVRSTVTTVPIPTRSTCSDALRHFRRNPKSARSSIRSSSSMPEGPRSRCCRKLDARRRKSPRSPDTRSPASSGFWKLIWLAQNRSRKPRSASWKNTDETKAANQAANRIGQKPAKYWSERRDLNPRPLVPQTSALTGLRHAPSLA